MSSACENVAIGGIFKVKLGRSMLVLNEQTMLCDLRDPPVLYVVGERVTDIKGNQCIIERFGVIVEINERDEDGKTKDRAIMRGAFCKSRGGHLRYLPLIHLEKVVDEPEDSFEED